MGISSVTVTSAAQSKDFRPTIYAASDSSNGILRVVQSGPPAHLMCGTCTVEEAHFAVRYSDAAVNLPSPPPNLGMQLRCQCRNS
jgi:hypothetical protein